MNQIEHQSACQFEDNNPSATLPEQQFTLHAADPASQTPFVQFQGVEYHTLQEASRAIVGQVGAFFALEILGRAFVLRSDDAVKFLEAKIPFHIGVGNNQTFSSTPGFFSGATDHIRWVDNEESSVMENAASQPVDWKGIRDEMESIRSNIGDLMDRLGEYGVERVSDQDREELAKLQVFLGEAHHSILAATS